ncbi:MAG: DUF971 domain-containing protein [Pseudomonadota bacterium]
MTETPTRVTVSKDRAELTLAFETIDAFTLPAEMLRVMSPSAEVQGHSPEQRKIVGGKRNITITGVAPVGHYAIRITFSDGHDTGLFTWPYLAELDADRDSKWAGYLDELSQKGMSR